MKERKFYQRRGCKAKEKIIRKKRDIQKDIILIQTKLHNWLADDKPLNLKENCIFEDGMIKMPCVMCNELKPRTTEYFNACHGGENFETCEPGHETLQNSIGHPCKTCRAELTQKRNITKDGFIHQLVMNYPQLSVEWFRKTFEKQNGRGLITNTELILTTHSKNCAGIHRYNNDLDHTPENCFLEVQELNIQQHDAIPSLFESWKQLFTLLVKNFKEKDNIDYLKPFQDQYNVTPKELGIIRGNDIKTYSKALRGQHLKTILSQQINSHIKHDIKTRGFKLPLNYSRSQFVSLVYPNVILQMEKQKARCGYTDIGLTIENLWTRFSLERINNDDFHFTETGELPNCILICRIFNVAKQLSRKMILEYLLQQILVHVPDEIREKVENLLKEEGYNEENKKRKVDC
jgi:hypothetical protein